MHDRRSEPAQRRLQNAHLVVGYAMSRLDKRFLSTFGFKTWQAAYELSSSRLDARWKSLKGLRDEFDPLHPHTGRKGWHGRPMLPDRIRVAAELSAVSDDALEELVRRLLDGDQTTTSEALDALNPSQSETAAAAERLLTGRRAEEFVLQNTKAVLGYPLAAVKDMRDSMSGFDLVIAVRPEIVVEVKGLRERTGDLLFTDREWSEAKGRRERYWLAVVGNLDEEPRAEVVRDPASGSRIRPRCVYERAVRVSWRGRFAMAALG